MELFAEIIIGFLQTSIFVFQLFLNTPPHTSIDLLNTFSRSSYCIWVKLKKRKTKTQNSVIISWSSFLKLLILTRVSMNVNNTNTVKLIALTPSMSPIGMDLIGVAHECCLLFSENLLYMSCNKDTWQLYFSLKCFKIYAKLLNVFVDINLSLFKISYFPYLLWMELP